MTPSWSARLLAARPRQPDRRSCGAAVLVVERALCDAAYAQFLVTGRHPTTRHERWGPLPLRFGEEVLGMHRRITGPVTVAGRLQLPWPRALGTPPWAVAGQLSTRRRVWVVRGAWRRRTLMEAIDRQLSAGTPVPLYVGSRLLPRHVVLLTAADAAGWDCYEPHHGDRRRVDRRDFLGGRLRLAGWSRPWFAVLLRPAP